MKKYTNYILRLEMLNVYMEVFLAALVTDVVIPPRLHERKLELSVKGDDATGVVCLRVPMTYEESVEMIKKFEHVPEDLVCFSYSDGLATISIVLRKLTIEESETMLGILRDEWDVRCSVLDEREAHKTKAA